MAKDPAEVDVSGEVGAQSDGGDFGGVGGGDGLEDAPRKTAEDFADEEHLDVDGEEGDEDEADLDQLLCQRPLSGVVISVHIPPRRGPSQW